MWYVVVLAFRPALCRNAHTARQDQMRRGFRNAAPGEAPGGAKSEKDENGARDAGTVNMGTDAPVARNSHIENDGPAVATITAMSALQL